MPSISRQYHPPSCRLEITAKISALSRWAQRPIIQSVNFLLSFPDISGKHHEPLEIRGNREQLQILSETVTDYVQGVLGQSLQTPVFNSAAAPAQPTDAIEATPTTVSNEKQALSPHLHPPVLHSRTLLTHELVLGALATNAENPSVCLKTSQLFDLVSALDDCADELEILPLPTPTRKPRIPVWASSAAMVVLTLGVTTATLQITQHTPETEDLVTTAADQSNQPKQPNQPSPPVEGAGIAPAPTDSSKPKAQSPTTGSRKSPLPTPTATAGTDPQGSPETNSTSPVTLAPDRQPPSPTPSTPLAQTKPKKPTPPPKSQPKDEGAIALADQSARSSPGPTPGNPTSLSAKLPNRSIAASPAAPNPSPSAAAAPVEAETNAEAEILHESDHLDEPRADVDDRKSRNQLGKQAPSTATFARTRDLHPQAFEIRQYISQRWRAPAGLTQPLQYQLTLNSKGSLSQVTPLNSAAAQYLGQVPLPAVNQPFISPSKSPSTDQVRLVLKPDGTVQTFVEPQVKPPANK